MVSWRCKNQRLLEVLLFAKQVSAYGASLCFRPIFICTWHSRRLLCYCERLPADNSLPFLDGYHFACLCGWNTLGFAI